jgi:hypothetical protein
MPVYLCGSLGLRDGRSLFVTITDLSSEGCKIRSTQMLPIGEIVRLEVPGRDTVRASVRWSMSGEAGLRFV